MGIDFGPMSEGLSEGFIGVCVIVAIYVSIISKWVVLKSQVKKIWKWFKTEISIGIMTTTETTTEITMYQAIKHKTQRNITCSNEKKRKRNSTKNNTANVQCYTKNPYYRITKETTESKV